MSFSPNPILMGRAPPLEVANISLAEQCARPVANEVGAPLFGGNSLNLHQFMRDVSGGCLALTVISCVYLTWTHLRRYTVPQEQRQIIRIANVPVFYCLFNFLALCWYPYYQYIEPIARIYEAFCVAALFFLLLEYIAPDGTDREKFFNNLEARSRRGKPLPGGSLKWFQVYNFSGSGCREHVSLVTLNCNSPPHMNSITNETTNTENLEQLSPISFDENRLRAHRDHHSIL